LGRRRGRNERIITWFIMRERENYKMKEEGEGGRRALGFEFQ
jgi:hypothetical protein